MFKMTHVLHTLYWGHSHAILVSTPISQLLKIPGYLHCLALNSFQFASFIKQGPAMNTVLQGEALISPCFRHQASSFAASKWHLVATTFGICRLLSPSISYSCSCPRLLLSIWCVHVRLSEPRWINCILSN